VARRSTFVPAAVVALALALAPPVGAQHATAFDVEDGKRVYQASCATCHGPDGNLIVGIDFSRAVYRRPFSDDELAALIVGGIPNTPMPPNPAMSRDQAL
jgi:mono/diheme cytochrome c family protein